MQQTKQTKDKEVGRIQVWEGQDIVVRLVDNERVDIRLWMKSERYTGPTKKGVRFYLFNGIWPQFYELMNQVNQEYEKMA